MPPRSDSIVARAQHGLVVPHLHDFGANNLLAGQDFEHRRRMTSSAENEKGTILLVDDEQAVRSIVLRILRRANYTVLEAESGDAALEIADAHDGPIDLVITDMFMPGLRGPEVIQRLAVKRPGLRALFMSGYADQDARTGVPAGANFLNKPFAGHELAAAVEAALKGPSVS